MSLRGSTTLVIAIALAFIGVACLWAVYLCVEPEIWEGLWPTPAIPVLIGSVAVGGVLVPLFLRKRFQPWRDAAEEASIVVRPDQRLRVPDGPEELKNLVTTLNGMLSRLERASQRERNFLGTASHELRRPLAALRMELELALNRNRPATELQDAIRLCLSDTESMTRLVDDLLFHARARAGALSLREEEVDVIDLVFSAVDSSQRAMSGQPSIQVHVEAIPALHIRADRAGLSQVLENLIVNARTHAGQEATIEIGGGTDEQSIVLWVQDDGPGIPIEEQELIFHAFGRGDRSPSVPGAGLGLAIARDLVLAHDGTIDVTSPIRAEDAKRPGTRFTTRLPIARRIQERVPDDVRSESLPADAPSARRVVPQSQ